VNAVVLLFVMLVNVPPETTNCCAREKKALAYLDGTP
jgi:hypothetical protein